MTLAGARILALDVGAKRIGLAVSDPLGLTAQGLPTLQRTRLSADLGHLAELARQYESRLWLVGMPLHLSGREGAQAAKIREFGTKLATATGVPIQYWDERLTTVEAQRVLRQADLSREKSRRAIDRLAAVILLQSYLDRSVTDGTGLP